MQKVRPAVGSFFGHSPAANTQVDQEFYTLTVDLPGVSKDNVDLHIEGNTLYLTAKRTTAREVAEKDYYRMESYFGQLQRAFTLPTEVEGEQIDAKLKDGVLRITLPIKECSKSRRIAVR
ncbi:Hsp20 family protein [Desulfurispira natronophila]|uniref:HSP20 family protein n=1 Tax=Desulfurispira natronophila TaxID=682562 RepID=A0A7W8DHF6_9BACT|nr:HSP20 family protein [Desulfurispira natronophila]